MKCLHCGREVDCPSEAAVVFWLMVAAVVMGATVAFVSSLLIG